MTWNFVRSLPTVNPNGSITTTVIFLTREREMPFAKPKIVLALGMAAVSAALSGCNTYQPAPKAFSEATIQPYMLDSGDRLRVTVFDQEGLTNTYTVDQAGYISFPLIGQVPARAARCSSSPARSRRNFARVTSATPMSPSISTATARSTSWAKSANLANIPTCPA